MLYFLLGLRFLFLRTLNFTKIKFLHFSSELCNFFHLVNLFTKMTLLFQRLVKMCLFFNFGNILFLFFFGKCYTCISYFSQILCQNRTLKEKICVKGNVLKKARIELLFSISEAKSLPKLHFSLQFWSKTCFFFIF